MALRRNANEHKRLMTNILDVQDVTRSFTRGKPVLNGVTFSVGQEEIVALLGRNGTGKTTLMSIIMGMLFPDAGSVRLFGLSPVDHPVEVKRRIGFVGEGQILPPRATIPELIALHRRLFRAWDTELEQLLLDRFGLAGNWSKIKELSKGQAQQVALLLAVCHRPELLLLDEPAAGLDPAARREFLETSIQLLNREGTSILFSSHHMGDVERLGGRVLLLDGGTVRLDRDLDLLRERHCVAVIAKRDVPEAQTLARLPGCLHVREIGEQWHAVFHGTPHEVRRMLSETLGLPNVVCSTMPLEELFVELVGGARKTAA